MPCKSVNLPTSFSTGFETIPRFPLEKLLYFLENCGEDVFMCTRRFGILPTILALGRDNFHDGTLRAS
jgi:hypothetical protein